MLYHDIDYLNASNVMEMNTNRKFKNCNIYDTDLFCIML